MAVNKFSKPFISKQTCADKTKKAREENIFRIIKNTPFFYEFTKSEFSDVAKEIFVHNIAEKNLVVPEKKRRDSIFFITSGAVNVSTLDPKTKTAVFLERLEAGDFFGETSLLTGRLRSSSVTTISDTELLEIPRDVYCKIGVKYPSAMRFLIDLCSRRDKKISNILKTSNVERRNSERILCKGKIIFQKHENEDDHKVIKVIMGLLVDISEAGISFKAHKNDFSEEITKILNSDVKTKIIIDHSGETEIKILGKIIDLESETTKVGFSDFYLARMEFLLIDKKDREYLQKLSLYEKQSRTLK